jgi:hypothetical protein
MVWLYTPCLVTIKLIERFPPLPDVRATRTPDYRWLGQMKISENLGVMYGQNFKNFSKYVRITAGMHGKG